MLSGFMLGGTALLADKRSDGRRVSCDIRRPVSAVVVVVVVVVRGPGRA